QAHPRDRRLRRARLRLQLLRRGRLRLRRVRHRAHDAAGQLGGRRRQRRHQGGREMEIRSQVDMEMHLHKCIGCHPCSTTSKHVWTSREGIEYAWYNNVETKPGIGYPKEWANQKKWRGGWVRNADGSINPRIGGKWRVLANIFANPDLPEIDDYYEPFTF